MYVNKDKKLKKYVASEFRRRMVYIIATELSDDFFHRTNLYIITKVAKLLKISQDTVKRYLREIEQENPEQVEEETPYIYHLELAADVLKSLSDKQRAVLILRLNKYQDEDRVSAWYQTTLCNKNLNNSYLFTFAEKVYWAKKQNVAS